MINITSIMESELRDFLSDLRALHELPNMVFVTDRVGLARRISLRKKEILSSLKHVFFDANPQLHSDDFSHWLSGHIQNTLTS